MRVLIEIQVSEDSVKDTDDLLRILSETIVNLDATFTCFDLEEAHEVFPFKQPPFGTIITETVRHDRNDNLVHLRMSINDEDMDQTCYTDGFKPEDQDSARIYTVGGKIKQVTQGPNSDEVTN